jgi:FkbM family methyltransferase
LPAVAAAAALHGARYAYDAEDFHLGEWPDDPAFESERRLVRAVEERYLPGCAYVTAASPGIAEAYTEAYGIERPRVVLNAFPLGHAAPAPTPRGTAQPGPSLYWFSQTIGPDRGIECAVRAVGRAGARPHLYLRGTPAAGYPARLLDVAREAGAAGRVHLLPPGEPDTMEELAAAYDVGLCSETGHTAGRRLCLTNKLFSFLLAGVPPLLSNTPAQCGFAAEAGLTDLLYARDDPAALARLLDRLLGDADRLAAARAQAWRLGQERYNWERERDVLIEAVGRLNRAPAAAGPAKVSTLDRLRQMRERSRVLKSVHASLREPYYGVLCFLYRRGVRVELPGRHGVRVHPRLLGIRPTGYEAALSAALDGRVSLGMTVVDVGAHVGLHSLRFSRAVGECGQVIAVEPSPANASLLRKHLEWNRCRNVTVIEAAAGECESEIEFAFRPDPTDPGSFANSVAYDIGGDTARVKVTTIDAVCRGLTPDVIKIDIEGAELLAVRGARSVLSKSSPILFVAVHPDAMRALGTSPSELVDLLGELGYVGRHLDGRVATKPGFEEIVFQKGSAGAPRGR